MVFCIETSNPQISSWAMITMHTWRILAWLSQWMEEITLHTQVCWWALLNIWHLNLQMVMLPSVVTYTHLAYCSTRWSPGNCHSPVTHPWQFTWDRCTNYRLRLRVSIPLFLKTLTRSYNAHWTKTLAAASRHQMILRKPTCNLWKPHCWMSSHPILQESL